MNNAYTNLQSINTSVTHTINHIIDSANSTLKAIAQYSTIDPKKPDECNSFLSNYLAADVSFYNIGIADTTGKIICHGLSNSITTLPSTSVAHREWFQEAIKSKTFSTGEYQEGVITRRQTVNFAYPILDDKGEVTYVLFLAIDLKHLKIHVENYSLPPESGLTVIDKNGTVLVRHPQDSVVAGASRSNTPIYEHLNKMKFENGYSFINDYNNETRFYTYSKINRTIAGKDYYIYISYPENFINSQADYLLKNSLSLVAIAIFSSILIAYIDWSLFLKEPR
jgi:hypothetical protein